MRKSTYLNWWLRGLEALMEEGQAVTLLLTEYLWLKTNQFWQRGLCNMAKEVKYKHLIGRLHRDKEPSAGM